MKISQMKSNGVKKFLSFLLAGSMLLPAFAFAARSSQGMMGGFYKNGANATGTKSTMMAVNMSVTTGTVTGVSGTSITMTSGSNTFTVDASAAKLYRKFGAVMSVADIQNGDSLTVNGVVSGSSITAKTIRDMSLQQKNATFTGSVSSVSGSGFVMATHERGSQTINTTSSTVFKEAGMSTVTMANVTAGENVRVEGVWDNTNNNVSANTITIVVKNGSWRVIFGSVSGMTITAIAANSSSTTYSIDATNAKLIRHFGAAMQLSDMQAGDILTVSGMLNGSSLTAKTVRDDSLQAHNGTFTGSVSAVLSNSFTLQSKERGSQTINTISTTIFRKGSASSTFADLAVGETVTVSGVWDRTNSNVTANRVMIKIPNVTITGTLSAISGMMLTVNASSTTYSVDATSSKIIFMRGHSGSLSNFQVNDNVKVWGSQLTTSSNVMAKIVQDLSRAYNATSTPQ